MDEFKIFSLLDDISHAAHMMDFLIRQQHPDHAKTHLPTLKKKVEELEKELEQ